jgi:hypothetical protein
MFILFHPLSSLPLRVREMCAQCGSTYEQSCFYYHIIEILKYFVSATTGLFLTAHALEPVVARTQHTAILLCSKFAGRKRHPQNISSDRSATKAGKQAGGV